MNFISRIGILYVKSLAVAVPTSVVIFNVENVFNFSDLNSYRSKTCAEKIVDKGVGCLANTLFGSVMGLAYPVSGPLYVMHKLEKTYPKKFKVCK
jgi:hypothetical protein